MSFLRKKRMHFIHIAFIIFTLLVHFFKDDWVIIIFYVNVSIGILVTSTIIMTVENKKNTEKKEILDRN